MILTTVCMPLCPDSSYSGLFVKVVMEMKSETKGGREGEEKEEETNKKEAKGSCWKLFVR
eukprot:gene8832-6215_t